jgi:hypothetical protein
MSIAIDSAGQRATENWVLARHAEKTVTLAQTPIPQATPQEPLNRQSFVERINKAPSQEMSLAEKVRQSRNSPELPWH